MEILQQSPDWINWIIGGVSLFSLSQALVWLADKVGNVTGAFDVPDGKYGFYGSWIAGLLAVLVILNTTSGFNIDLDFYVSLVVAIVAALGYDWGSAARNRS